MKNRAAIGFSWHPPVFYLTLLTLSSFRGLREVIERKGLFSSLYTDRGSHYWFTEEAGGNVDKTRLTQVHRALQQ